MRTLAMRLRRQHDGGFSLVEVVVAMGILVIVMLALLTALTAGLRAVTLGRANQQAGSLANAELEAIRSLPFNQVTLATGDSTITAASYNSEAMEIAAAGAINPHVKAVASDTRTYDVRRYVTRVTTDASGTVLTRRVTIEVSWTQNGVPHSRRVSTVVTNTRRGLPLPQFRWSYNGTAPGVAGVYSITRGQSASADFGFTLRNLGARDTWNLTADQAGWTYFRDTNRDGVWSQDPLGEPPLGDTDGDGVPDTGPIEPSTAPAFFVAQRITGATESGTQTITFTATSSAQPAIGAKVVIGELTVSSTGGTPAPPSGGTPVVCAAGSPVQEPGGSLLPVIPGSYSPLTLTLLNGPPDGDTARLPSNVMSTDLALQSAVCNYSTDVQTDLAGRAVDASSPATWTFQPTSSAMDRYRGTAVLKLWIACDPGAAPTVTAELRSGSTLGSQHASKSKVLSLSDCNGQYRGVPFDLAMAGAFDVPASSADRLGIVLRSDLPVRVLYDAPDSGATLVIGAK